MMKRIFIVGIARSGTTLLQSIVGNHPDICTFPETHFFSNTMPKQKSLRLLHKISSEHQKIVEDFFVENHLEGYETYDGGARNMNQWTSYLIKMMDNIAKSNNQSVWLEKTPMHLYYTKLIEKNASNCYFIHTIREPKANIAALYDVSKKHPGAFKQASLEKAIDRYTKEISISNILSEKDNHLHVYYEDIVTQPERTVKAIFEFLQLDFDSRVLDFKSNVEGIVSKEESWKSNNQNELALKDKINERLTTSEIDRIVEELNHYPFHILTRYDED